MVSRYNRTKEYYAKPSFEKRTGIERERERERNLDRSMGHLTCLAQLIALQGNEFVTTFIGMKRIEES